MDESTGNLQDHELPQIVWLRGNEPYIQEFNLTADDVMQTLEIKRSRLTQISGKELRVGRIRQDRYIKPVYRSKDVESYLQWTRATATHLKSSAALAQASEQIQNYHDTLKNMILELLPTLFEELSSVHYKGNKEIIEVSKNQQSNHLLHIKNILFAINTHWQGTITSIQQQLQTLSDTPQYIKTLGHELLVIQQRHGEIQRQIALMREYITERFAALSNEIKTAKIEAVVQPKVLFNRQMRKKSMSQLNVLPQVAIFTRAKKMRKSKLGSGRK